MPHVRCSRCEARRTLPRHPSEYTRAMRCPGCGELLQPAPVDLRTPHWRVDHYRRTRERGPRSPKPCRCGEYIGRDGNNMPHRHGSGWCAHNPRIADADRQERWEAGASASRRWA